MCRCKICNSNSVIELSDNDCVSYKNNELSVVIDYSECRECGREFISKKQILNNELVIREAKKKHDGLLLKDDIVKARKDLNITQEEAAKIFGGGRNAFSKYERGEVSQSVAMDKLIRICLENRTIFNQLSKDSGIVVIDGEDQCWGNVISYKKHKDNIISNKNKLLKNASCVPLSGEDVSYGS